MTVFEVLDQAWLEAGEPSDLDADFSIGTFDPISTAGVRMLRYVNNSIVRIGNWRFRDGRLLRLRSLLARKAFRTGYENEFTVTAAIALSGFQVDPPQTLGTADPYTGWVVEVTEGTGVGQVRLVVASSYGAVAGLVCSVNQDFDTALDATSVVQFRKNFVEFLSATETNTLGGNVVLNPVTALGDILKVRDLGTATDLTPTLRENLFTGNVLQSGTPSEYRIYGNRVYFDVAIDAETVYEILYLKQPAKVAVGTDVPELPEQYHEALTLWVTHNIQRMNQDYDKAYATKRELEDLMMMTREQGSSEMDMEQGGIIIWG